MPEPIQLINPNLHVLTIHFPIALLFVGTIIELLAFLWRRSGFRAAGRWMILIGAICIIPTATTGLHAARQAMDTSPDETLVDLKHEAPMDAAQWGLLRDHIVLNACAVGILAVIVVAWLGASDRVRQRGHFIYLIALLVACGLITAGAWHGGELVYGHGTGTHLVKGGWPPGPKEDSSDKTSGDGRPLFRALNSAEGQIHRFDDTMDIHIDLAGWTAAIAILTLGLSLRNLWLNPRRAAGETATSDDDIVNALASRGEQRDLLRQPAPSGAMVELPPRVPASRFWVLACVLGVITAILGLMLIAPSSFSDLGKMLKDFPRYMAHTICGVSIVVLTIILALVARFAPFNRLLISGFSLLLVLVLAAQVWLGILLLYDTNEGPVNHFNVATTQSSVM